MKTNVLNGIVGETEQILLGADEEWQGNLMQNRVDLWHHYLPRDRIVEALPQELK